MTAFSLYPASSAALFSCFLGLGYRHVRSLQNKEIIIVNSKKAEASNPKLEPLQAGSSAAVAKQRSKACSAPRVGLGFGLLLPRVPVFWSWKGSTWPSFALAQGRERGNRRRGQGSCTRHRHLQPEACSCPKDLSASPASVEFEARLSALAGICQAGLFCFYPVILFIYFASGLSAASNTCSQVRLSWCSIKDGNPYDPV